MKKIAVFASGGGTDFQSVIDANETKKFCEISYLVASKPEIGAIKRAEKHGIKDNDYVDVEVEGIKPTRFYDVQVRVREDFNVEMHIDTDDANSTGLKNGSLVRIIRK